MPPAASSRLILDLPPTHRPLIEGGVIREGNPSAEAADASSDVRRWEMLLGGSSNAKLRFIAATTERAENVPDVRLRDEVAFRIDERGVNIVTTLRCEGAIQLLRELVVPLPEGVQFISAESEGVELAWQISTHGANAAAAVVIETPKPLARDHFAVTIRAWHPLPTTHPWRLPSLRPEGILWVSGTLELSLSPSLELKRLSPIDCVQTGVVQSPGDLAGSETHWFTVYSPTAGLELSVDSREPSVSARLDSSLSISETETDGRLTTQLDVKHGSVHKLTGELAQGWTVESVESIPDDAIGEWIVNRRDGITEIEIQLAQSPSARRPVTVRVDGRLEPTSYAEPISSETLRMVRWHGVDVTAHLLSFQAAEPYAAEPMGELPIATSEQVVAGPKVRQNSAQAAAFDLTHAPRAPLFASCWSVENLRPTSLSTRNWLATKRGWRTNSWHDRSKAASTAYWFFPIHRWATICVGPTENLVQLFRPNGWRPRTRSEQVIPKAANCGWCDCRSRPPGRLKSSLRRH